MTGHAHHFRTPAGRLLALAVTALVAGSIVGNTEPAGAAIPARSADSLATPPTIPVGSNPIDIAIAPSRSEGFVLNDGSISVISMQTHRQVAEFKTGFTDQTTLALVRGGTRAYVGTFDESVLKVVDTEQRKVVGHLQIGKGADDIAVAKTTAGERAYVAVLTDKQLVVMDTKTRTITKRVAMPRGPQVVQAKADGQAVWAGSSYSGKIWVVSTATGAIKRTISVPKSGPVTGIAFSPGGGRAYVVGLGGLSVVDVTSGKVVGFVPDVVLFPREQSINPESIAVNNSGSVVMAVNSTFPDAPTQGSVSFVSSKTLKVQKVVKLGTEPEGVAIDRQRGETYVTNYADDTVSYFPTPK